MSNDNTQKAAPKKKKAAPKKKTTTKKVSSTALKINQESGNWIEDWILTTVTSFLCHHAFVNEN